MPHEEDEEHEDENEENKDEVVEGEEVVEEGGDYDDKEKIKVCRLAAGKSARLVVVLRLLGRRGHLVAVLFL